MDDPLPLSICLSLSLLVIFLSYRISLVLSFFLSLSFSFLPSLSFSFPISPRVLSFSPSFLYHLYLSLLLFSTIFLFINVSYLPLSTHRSLCPSLSLSLTLSLTPSYLHKVHFSAHLLSCLSLYLSFLFSLSLSFPLVFFSSLWVISLSLLLLYHLPLSPLPLPSPSSFLEVNAVRMNNAEVFLQRLSPNLSKRNSKLSTFDCCSRNKLDQICLELCSFVDSGANPIKEKFRI